MTNGFTADQNPDFRLRVMQEPKNYVTLGDGRGQQFLDSHPDALAAARLRVEAMEAERSAVQARAIGSSALGGAES